MERKHNLPACKMLQSDLFSKHPHFPYSFYFITPGKKNSIVCYCDSGSYILDLFSLFLSQGSSEPHHIGNADSQEFFTGHIVNPAGLHPKYKTREKLCVC